MNKIYKVIYSETRKAWVVVSELVTGHKKSSGKRAMRAALAAAVLSTFAAGLCTPSRAENYVAPDNTASESPASAGGDKNVSLGPSSSIGLSSYDIAIGDTATIGNNSSNSVSVGQGSTIGASAYNSIAIGQGSSITQNAYNSIVTHSSHA